MMQDTQTITLPEFFATFPKVDLHYHLLGGVRLTTMLALAEKYGCRSPNPKPKVIIAVFSMKPAW